MTTNETSPRSLSPDPKNQLSWSTSGSVQKNLPHLLRAHTTLLSSPDVRSMLEIASGFGDHVIAYASALPDVEFWPTECNEYLVSKLEEKVGESGAGNVRKARKLDILEGGDWESLRHEKTTPFDAISVTNLVNVTPWKVTETLFKELGHCERPILNRVHGRLALYCCLREDGKFLSQADEKFDGELRGRSPDFGIRNLQDIVGLAEEEGLQLLSKEFLAGGTNQFLQFGFKQ